MNTFCATCLEEGTAAALREVEIDGRTLTLCHRCDAGHPRTGRWAFGGEAAVGMRRTVSVATRGR